jgi:hypothetical protein
MQVATLSQCRDRHAEIVVPEEAECRAMASAFEGGEAVIDREWAALTRMMDALAPGYAQ